MVMRPCSFGNVGRDAMLGRVQQEAEKSRGEENCLKNKVGVGKRRGVTPASWRLRGWIPSRQSSSLRICQSLKFHDTRRRSRTKRQREAAASERLTDERKRTSGIANPYSSIGGIIQTPRQPCQRRVRP